ncbi:MAG: nicotinate-nucleotide--dimethylbenzimidazole phosphoribosyltransferase [Magnetococcales bacterium]|nr:nicotinate-nucleotide--dimethylbenzimidazole phosphoribosyltransferase [Magnetococcales bacterium]
MSPYWLHQPIRIPAEPAPNSSQAVRPFGPPGALGTLGEIARRMAAMQGTSAPVADPAWATVFVADHGVARAGIAGHTEQDTLAWVRSCLRGESASAVMARHLGIPYEVVDVGMRETPDALPGLISQRAGNGTHDFRHAPAMSEMQLHTALNAGRDAVERARQAGTRIFIAGEIATGKSTSAGALACALLGMPPETVAGPGSGIPPEMISVKADIIQGAVDHHQKFITNPLDLLRRLGGFETVAMCGAYVACGQFGITAIVDGLCSTVAALFAITLHPSLKQWLFVGHRAAEPGQYPILRNLDLRPILNLDMRLGEGSGALAALPVLRMACALSGAPER